MDKISNIFNIPKLFLTKKPNLIITLSNMFTFMTVQILFFYFIATNLFPKLILSKTSALKEYNQYDSNTRKVFQDFKNSNEFKRLERIKGNQEELRNYLNIQLIMNKLIPIVMVILFFILANIIRLQLDTTQHFAFVDGFLLFLVLFAFTTEVIYFFFIVEQYYFVGDIELIKKFYDKLVKLYYNK